MDFEAFGLSLKFVPPRKVIFGPDSAKQRREIEETKSMGPESPQESPCTRSRRRGSSISEIKAQIQSEEMAKTDGQSRLEAVKTNLLLKKFMIVRLAEETAKTLVPQNKSNGETLIGKWAEKFTRKCQRSEVKTSSKLRKLGADPDQETILSRSKIQMIKKIFDLLDKTFEKVSHMSTYQKYSALKTFSKLQKIVYYYDEHYLFDSLCPFKSYQVLNHKGKDKPKSTTENNEHYKSINEALEMGRKYASLAKAVYLDEVESRSWFGKKPTNEEIFCTNCKELSLSPSDILYSQWKNQVFSPAFCVVRNRNLRELYVSIRGSSNTFDFVTDLLFHYLCIRVILPRRQKETGKLMTAPRYEPLYIVHQQEGFKEIQNLVGGFNLFLQINSQCADSDISEYDPNQNVSPVQKKHKLNCVNNARDMLENVDESDLEPLEETDFITHVGIFHSAINVYKAIFPMLKGLLQKGGEYHGYRLLIVGHSLGAAIASLLQLFLESGADPVVSPVSQTINYAPAPTLLPARMTKDWEKATKADPKSSVRSDSSEKSELLGKLCSLNLRCLNFVNSFDLVPRCSYGMMKDLEHIILEMGKKEIQDEFQGMIRKWKTRKMHFHKWSPERFTKYEKLRNLYKVIRDKHMVHVKLVAPGRTFFILMSSKDKTKGAIEEIKVHALSEVHLSRKMVSDHLLDAYIENLNLNLEIVV